MYIYKKSILDLANKLNDKYDIHIYIYIKKSLFAKTVNSISFNFQKSCFFIMLSCFYCFIVLVSCFFVIFLT